MRTVTSSAKSRFGPTIMKGYYNRPDATAQVLRDGWLYTGDLAYTDARGNYFISGRAKDVIVLSSGKNIYPEEIESYYLRSVRGSRNSASSAWKPAPGEPLSERLHGVIVPNFEVLRSNKIVNIREVVRYDIESISAHLPATKRILPMTSGRKIFPAPPPANCAATRSNHGFAGCKPAAPAIPRGKLPAN